MGKIEKTNKIYDYLNKIRNKEIEEKDNGSAELIYFYMNGCHYCEQFNPVWNEFRENVNENMIKTLRFGGHEIDNRDTPQRIITEYGKEIEGFPTVLLKLDDKFYNFDKDRTVKSLAEFIMEKLDENDKLYKYLNDKFSELKNNIEKDDKNKNYDPFNCNGKQNGGMKNVDYRNKYKKYKQMYAELAIKYNELKKNK
jgi:thiol-disulfide isomerase/thioredoxin